VLRAWFDKLSIPDARMKEARAIHIKTMFTRTSHTLDIVVQMEEDLTGELGME
jgi:hypothetical protein